MKIDDRIDKLKEWVERPERIYKLKVGWKVLNHRYYGIGVSWRLLLFPVFLAPLLLIAVLPWYLLGPIAKLEFADIILFLLAIPASVLGIIFCLLLANYAYINNWEN